MSSRNRPDKIAALVESILHSDEPDFECVLLDQSDDVRTERTIEPFLQDPRVRYVRSDQRGTSRGRNLAISQTTAPIIAITDDDCIVPTDWLSRMIDPFDRDPRIGLVFCNVAPVPVNDIGFTPSVRFSRNCTLTSPRAGWASARQHFVLGAGMAVRRSTFEALGHFDVVLGPGSVFAACEDNDLMWRALIFGWSVHQTLETTVLHDGFRSMDEVRDLVQRDCYGAGGAMAKYIKTGHWDVVRHLLSAVVALGVVEPMKALISGRRPRGFRRAVWLLNGTVDGLRTPVDGGRLLFRVTENS